MKKIALTGVNGKGKYTLVDSADYEKASQIKWYYHKGYAANKTRKRGMLLLHIFILGKKDGYEIDHINGNRLDNRRKNLRYCTHQENTFNSKPHTKNNFGYKGVGFSKQKNKWQAYITYDDKFIFIGFFKTPREAAEVYDAKAKELFGEFAKLNFPKDTHITIKQLRDAYKKFHSKTDIV